MYSCCTMASRWLSKKMIWSRLTHLVWVNNLIYIWCNIFSDDLKYSNFFSFFLPSDLVEDICQLKHLNEASVLHCLRQRYANNLIHTRAGPSLIVVNPMAPLSLYSEKVVSMFRGCKSEDMPPHIYSTSQSAYRNMLETRRDQSLIFLGRSGLLRFFFVFIMLSY